MLMWPMYKTQGLSKLQLCEPFKEPNSGGPERTQRTINRPTPYARAYRSPTPGALPGAYQSDGSSVWSSSSLGSLNDSPKLVDTVFNFMDTSSTGAFAQPTSRPAYAVHFANNPEVSDGEVEVEEVVKIPRPRGQNGHPKTGFSLESAISDCIGPEEYKAIQVRTIVDISARRLMERSSKLF